MRLLKDPSVYFLLIGTSIFGFYSVYQTDDQASMDSRIVVDGPTQEWIHGNFAKQFRRSPTRAEMDALVQAYIEGEVKYRHALDMGLDYRDAIIRRRMMQKFDFLFGNAAADSLPKDTELREWYQANSDEFMEPASISFSHLYFSPDKRASVASDAAAALEALRDNTKPASDQFPFEVRFEAATTREVRNVLGPEFTQAVFEAPIGLWFGPIHSGLGYHLVLVSERTPGSLPPFEDVRGAVLQRWRDEESARILVELIAMLTSQIEIEIDAESLAQFDYSPGSEAILQ